MGWDGMFLLFFFCFVVFLKSRRFFGGWHFFWGGVYKPNAQNVYGMFNYIWFIFMVNVGKNTSPMGFL